MGKLNELYEKHGQSPWLDNLKRGWITSGELERWIDPNDWQVEQETPEGLCMVPITTDKRRRFGARERIREVQASSARPRETNVCARSVSMKPSLLLSPSRANVRAAGVSSSRAPFQSSSTV